MMFDDFRKEMAMKSIEETFRETEFFQEKKQLSENIAKEVTRLEKAKEKLINDKKTIMKNAILRNYDQEIIDELVQDVDKAIKIIEEQIIELSEWNEYETLIEELPKTLMETFELSLSSFNKAENEQKKENIFKLLEMTAFELSVDNKKELKIKLFEVIDTLLRGGLSGLEAPAGVEPASKALQASV